MKQEILITEYDPKWPLIFQREKEKILVAIGEYIKAIEHIGSTSVVGLAANRHFHLHIAEENSSFWKEHILFRDFLRRDPSLAHHYEELKKQLAVTSHGDIQLYCSGKSEFIKKVIQHNCLCGEQMV
ncbi:MAG: GrpB family protein [Pseudomonadota bacterium]|nr:GrpB family protein [Gammaproteobacteria bacterium]MBU1927293.1 GrpB family protein [Gammaproteobacteria bacterium]MBU2546328.1 GrpB family protein [Gammaproteobacteria bacterium]